LGPRDVTDVISTAASDLVVCTKTLIEVEECQREYRVWRESIWLAAPSQGKAQYIDGIPSVRAASIPGLKSEEKTVHVLHIQVEMNR
jgi:hypothetical protein